MTSVPMRTCVGCRTVKPKAELVRLARGRDGRVVVDREARAMGRGAYVCPDMGCVERALQRGRLAHAFRSSCDVRDGLADVVGNGRRVT